MIATRPIEQVRTGDTIHGVSVLKVLHRGHVKAMPYPAREAGRILVPLQCEVHGEEELLVEPRKLANVERTV